MKAAYAKYHKKGFEIITITCELEKDRDAVRKYVQRKGLVWPHYFDGLYVDNPYIRRYGLTGMPAHFLLDKNGLLATTEVRREKLEPAIERLLAL